MAQYGGSGGRGGVEPPPKLEPKALFEKRAARDKARLRAQNQLLGQIQNRIYTTSQLPGNPNYLVQSVPPFILGLPSLDLQDCIVQLVHMLRQQTQEVRFTYPNLLQISWKHHEKDQLSQSNPIAQAMMPPPAPKNSSLKGAGGGRGRGASAQAVTFAPSATVSFGEPVTAPPPRNAHDQEPPNSFMQTMQRPLPTPKPNTPVMTSSERTPSDVLADLWKFT